MSSPGAAITIDVTQDLESSSDLQNLISSQGKAVFQLASALAQNAGQPVSAAVGSSALSLNLTASPTWTAGAVSFSLTPQAKCTVTIANSGETLPVALKVDSTDTTDVQLAPAAGMTYINIELDFDISGSASGSGTVYGLTISGTASGSANTTLCFCQPVPSVTETIAALKMAFSAIVFPTSPDCALRMAVGSSTRMNFDGTLNWEVDASYGLADYKLSAPSAALVQQSVAKAWQNLTLPSAEIKAGATGSVTYSHTDHFGIVVEKKDANTAMLYLVRSSTNDIGATAGITVGITTTGVSLSLNSTQIQQTVQTITGSATLASSVASAVAQPVNNLETAATKKLNTWISDGSGSAGLSFALSQQTGRTALFNFRVDLSQAAVTSWKELLSANIVDPQNIAGFTLLPGSGVAEQFNRSSTLQFHFFNLYSYSNVTNFFDNCSSELAADGTIRIVYDIGIEGTVTTNKADDQISIHFSATATEDTQANVGNAEIDLNIEISEKGDTAGAVALANILGMMNLSSLDSAIGEMSLYAQSNPGTLELAVTMKPSAYGRLACSPYLGKKPPQDQSQDESNWNAIHDATVALMNLDFVKPWTYSDWGVFNSYCNTGSSDSLPDRRNSGNPNAVPGSFWTRDPARSVFIQYFFLATAGGMNLFEDLVTLANDVANAVTDAQWKLIRQRVIAIVKGDVNIDYSKPIAAAILSRVAQGGAQTTVSTAQASDLSTFTTTLTIA